MKGFNNFSIDFKENPLKFFKEYIGVIVAIPAILGGIWQVIALAYISPSFIRFYSISQVVADGLLILLVGSVVIIVMGITSQIFSDSGTKPESVQSDDDKGDDRIPLNDGCATWFFTIIIISLSLVTLYFQFYEDFEPLIFKFVVVIPLLFLLPISIGNFVSKVMVRAQLKNDKYGWINIFPLALILISLWKSVALFHNGFSLPSNLKNLENVECLTKKYTKDEESKARIIYFNDKYLFVEYNHVMKIDTLRVLTEPQYIVFAFEKIVEDDFCDKNFEPKKLDFSIE